ncbi:MAG: magnesium transporter [Eubacteriales bacterium]
MLELDELEFDILDLIKSHEFKKLKTFLETVHPVDLAEILEEFNDKNLVIIFRLLPKEEAAETFTNMNRDMQETLLQALNEEEIREVMEELYLDDTVDILEEMPANVVDKLLDMTDADTRTRINELLNYPDDSAGSIMTVEYIALRKEMTVAESILKLRQIGINKETIYTCYVTEKRKLIGTVMLMDMLASRDDETIEEIMESHLISVHTDDNQEDVAKLTRKYHLLAIPVIDHEDCMVGIVTVDDAILVLQDETTEDINRMAAMLPTDESYFDTSVLMHVRNRLPWLLFLMLSATITGLILTHYDPVIAIMPILVTVIPMLMGTGGNCGSQSSSLIIRGLSVDEIEFTDIFKIIYKECRIALTVGITLAIINGIRVMIMYQNFELALMLGISLIITILMAKLVGCSLPLLAVKLGLDPAIMAAPIITTLVDSGSMFILFQIATIIYL